MTDEIRIAVVTGGGHGIGRALCKRLARDGITVVVADLEPDAAATVAADIGGIPWVVDVSNESAVEALVEGVESDVGPIELFVSNAGVGYGDANGNAASAASAAAAQASSHSRSSASTSSTMRSRATG